MSLNLFRKKTITEVGAQLNVHPFDISRHFGQKENGLPSDLRFDDDQIAAIAEGMRIEFWWKGDIETKDSNHARRLIRELARKIMSIKVGEPTRSDNLCRGLDGEDYRLILKTVNTFIMMGILQSVATSDGVDVELVDGSKPVLKGIAEGTKIPDELQDLM
jgi:hypothetical protein